MADTDYRVVNLLSESLGAFGKETIKTVGEGVVTAPTHAKHPPDYDDIQHNNI